MKSLLVITLIVASVALMGCASTMPAWFQKEEIVPRSAPGTKIYCDVVNKTDPQLTLEAVYINDVNVGVAIGDDEPLNWGEKYSFQIGYGLWQNSAQDVRGRANTGGGYSEIAIYANVYAIGSLPDATRVMVYPRSENQNGEIKLTSARNNSLVFERYNIARPTPSENPHTKKRR